MYQDEQEFKSAAIRTQLRSGVKPIDAIQRANIAVMDRQINEAVEENSPIHSSISFIPRAQFGFASICQSNRQNQNGFNCQGK